MKARVVIGVIATIVLVAAGMGIFAWNAKPELIEVYPKEGEVNVAATTPIRLVFSRAMDQGSVGDHLKITPPIEGTIAWEQNTLTFIPRQPWPSGQEISLELEAGAHADDWQAFPMGKTSWSFKTSGELLAYLWPSDRQADLYALDPLTGAIHQFTYGLGVLDYSVSNDGMKFFLSVSNSHGGADLYRLNRTSVESSTNSPDQAEVLFDCGTAQCRSPAVSTDERYLAYEYILPNPGGGLAPAQIWLLDLQSLQAEAVGQESHETIQPGWSDDGRLSYYDRTIGGYEVVNIVSHEKMLLPNQTGQPGAWSPDGKYYLAPEISYLQAAGGNETGTSHLIRYDVGENTIEDLSGANEVEDVEAGYSPDGDSIAFARKFLDTARWAPGRQIWVMNADGSNPHPITDEADYNHYDLAWSRDGHALTYVRFNQVLLFRPPELWMINIDGSNPVQLVIGAYSPLWIP